MRRSFPVMASAALFLACGSGSSRGGGAPGTPPFLFYSSAPAAGSAIGGLYAIGGDNPTSPVTLDAAALGSGNGRVAWGVAWAGNVAAGSVLDARQHAVVYVAGGKLYKQYADKPPAPVRVSSLSTVGSGPGDGSAAATAEDLCLLWVESDYANPENSVIVMVQAGAAGRCASSVDQVWSWTSMGAGPASAPGTGGYPMRAVRDPSGAISHLVGVVANGPGLSLARFDTAPGAPPATISPALFYLAYDLGQVSATSSLFLLRDSAGAGGFYLVDSVASAVTGPLGTIRDPSNWLAWSGIASFAEDGRDAYYVDVSSTGPALTIWRFPLDGSAPASIFATLPAPVASFVLTDAHVVASTLSAVISVPKAGGAEITLATANPGELLSLWPASKAGYVYFSRTGATPANGRAEAVRADGTGAMSIGEPNGARWIASAGSTTFSAWDQPWQVTPLRMLVCELAPGASDLGDAVVGAVDAGSPTRTGIELGRVPAGTSSLRGWSVGTRVLLVGTLANGLGGFQDDIFHLDTEKARSLARVTATTTVQEQDMWIVY